VGLVAIAHAPVSAKDAQRQNFVKPGSARKFRASFAASTAIWIRRTPMSVPGLGPVGIDQHGLQLATALRLPGHGPLAAGSAAEISRAAAIGASEIQTIVAEESLTPVDLGLLAPGEAPSDASIGLYSSELGDPTQMARDTQAANVALQAALDATIEIENRVAAALALAIQSDVAEDAVRLLQAIEDGDASATALASKLPANAAIPNETAVAPPPAPAISAEQAALAARLQDLFAAAQTGGAAGAEALARTIGILQATIPDDSLPPAQGLRSLAQLLLPAAALPLSAAEINPMLAAMQVSLMLAAKSTLERLRKLREDRMKVLALSAFARLETDESRESE